VPAFWLGLGIGSLLLVVIPALAPLAGERDGRRGEVGEDATTYLRIAALGAPPSCSPPPGRATCAASATSRTPLMILVAAHA
jgi:Na+-driven multidrug efflux pump